jgi:hypothetical protein
VSGNKELETIFGLKKKKVIEGQRKLHSEEFYLLGYNAVYSTESQLTFRRNTSLPPSG